MLLHRPKIPINLVNFCLLFGRVFFMLLRQKFAINLVNLCLIFWRFFFAAQAKVCPKIGEFLPHFEGNKWDGGWYTQYPMIGNGDQK